MRKMPFIEKRPESGLTTQERRFLTAYSILPFDNEMLYRAFVAPNWKGTINKLRLEAVSLLETNDAKQYLKDIDVVANKGEVVKIKRTTISKEDLEEKIEDATMALGELLCDKVLDITDPEQQRSIDVFLKNYASTIKDAEVTPPLRILSEQCSTCRYRLFVEENYNEE